MERLFGGTAGPGFGGLLAGSFLGSLAGTVIGSMIAREFLAHAMDRETTVESGSDRDLASEDTDVDTGEQVAGDFDDDMRPTRNRRFCTSSDGWLLSWVSPSRLLGDGKAGGLEHAPGLHEMILFVDDARSGGRP